MLFPVRRETEHINGAYIFIIEILDKDVGEWSECPGHQTKELPCFGERLFVAHVIATTTFVVEPHCAVHNERGGLNIANKCIVLGFLTLRANKPGEDMLRYE